MADNTERHGPLPRHHPRAAVQPQCSLHDTQAYRAAVPAAVEPGPLYEHALKLTVCCPDGCCKGQRCYSAQYIIIAIR